jgi:hypothetical protein
VQIRRLGFVPAQVKLEAGGDTSLLVHLIPTAQALAETMVAVSQAYRSLELNGFYRRLQDKEKGINAGHFITLEEIEQRKPYRVTHLFDGLAGVKMQRIISASRGGPETCLRLDPECIAPSGSNNCAVTVYLNGMRLNALRGPKSGEIGEMSWASGIDNLVSWSAVSGIEVYSSASRIPPEYQRMSGLCGAILIWTK